MPQLDKVSYFSQFFWLCFFYLSFYLILVKFFLPKVRRILKVREKKASYGLNGLDSNYADENIQVQEQIQRHLLEGMKSSRESLQSSFHLTDQWFQNVTTTTNTEQLQQVNTQYGQKMKEMAQSLVSTFHDLKTILPPTAHVQCGFQKNGDQKRQKFFNARVLASLFHLQPKGARKVAKRNIKK